MTSQSKTITSISDLIEHIRNSGDYMPWFRGQRKESWPLQPYIYRNYTPHLESQMIQRFMLKAQVFIDNCPAKTEYGDWLVLMQHYGLPTRLLDWSESPLVAAYFATAGNKGTEDASISMLNPGLLNSSLHEFETLPNLSTLSPELRERCQNAFKLPKNRTTSFRPVAVIASQNDFRMLNQMSCFTLHDMSAPLDEHEQSPFLEKVVIPAKHINRIRSELVILGIRRSILFPDIENYAKELRSLQKK
ncbi:FRG domain-containing protein [Maridesulfovibrio frigidus]|uniref:FRG domain-containing protein n=1 Tax=Maridesulfovibrio frigidus TaxID=340956 RepID=UPI0006925EE4|nr:FRG domain-containing protein [Maridesulfovibrio frigidus]